MGQELEFKYGLKGPEQFESLRQILEAAYPGPWEVVKMETDYYDTADHALAARKWTLRVRYEGGVSVLCLKTPGKGRARCEWEVVEGVLPTGLLVLVRRGAPEELIDLCASGLRPQCGARFRRRRCLIHIPGAAVELALDRGVLLGGGKELPFWELEAELKEGSAEALTQWCGALAQEHGLQEEPRSKFLRAAALIRR